ncbi:hypothetical protein Tco_0231425 [Tanacetum coccineum]
MCLLCQSTDSCVTNSPDMKFNLARSAKVPFPLGTSTRYKPVSKQVLQETRKSSIPKRHRPLAPPRQNELLIITVQNSEFTTTAMNSQVQSWFQKLFLKQTRQLRIFARSYALSWKPCQGDYFNLPDHRIHKDGDGDASFQLELNSLPHAHAQTTKTYYKHQDSRIMKA